MPKSPLPPMNAYYRCMSRQVESKSFLFIELNHSIPFYFHPNYIDKTLYLLSLVCLVSLLVQPIAEQGQLIACFHTKLLWIG